MKHYFIIFLFLHFCIVYSNAQNKGIDQTSTDTGKQQKIRTDKMQQTFDKYMEYINRLLECNTMEEVNLHFLENDSIFPSLFADFDKSFQYFTSEQQEEIVTKNYQLREKMDSLELAYKLNPDSINIFIDVFEQKVKDDILPSRSLLYLNDCHVRKVRHDCADKVTGHSYHVLTESLNEDQKERIEKIMSMCRSEADILIKEKSYDTSVQLVLDDLITYSLKIKQLKTLEEFQQHDCYFEFLGKLLVGEYFDTSRLDAKQKEDFLNVLICHFHKSDELVKIRDGEAKYVYFETVDELITLAKSFYDKKLKKIKNVKELNVEDESYFWEMRGILNEMSRNNPNQIIEESKWKNMVILFDKYDKLY